MTSKQYAALLIYELMLYNFTAERGPNPDVTKLTHAKGRSVYIFEGGSTVKVHAYRITRSAMQGQEITEFNQQDLMILVNALVRKLNLV